MIVAHPLRSLGPASAALSIVLAPAIASAQASPLSESIVLGSWTFRPSLEVRVRGEYTRHPVDTGGREYASTAVLAEGYKATDPTVVTTGPAVKNQYVVSERSRLGLAVDRGPVTAALTLQDARVFGDASSAFVGPGEPKLPSLQPFEAYIDLHARSGRKMFLRLGRQRVRWGDGRLVGDNDWSFTGRSLDAARFGIEVADIDIEVMAAMLAAPGGLPPAAGGSRTPAGEGLGAQLYGIDATYHLLPLLQIEVTGLARISRDPLPTTLTPADTFVVDGRIFGERRGFRYAVEGAYQLGTIASYGTRRSHQAFAVAARAGWLTALPAHLAFDAEAAYASGDDGDFSGTQKRFDPILPDQRTFLSPMSAFAWSNILTAGGSVSATPIDELGLKVGYHPGLLASKSGRWTTGDLVPVGAKVDNSSAFLGHEIDYAMKIMPWKPLDIEAGYGLMILGDGARAILRDVGRPATLEHWAYVQTTVRAPW
ncbi:MAG: alginate export family protein [Byssovorax sp.]